MIDLRWSTPARAVEVGQARRGILQQHEWIRLVPGGAGAAAKARLEEGLNPDLVRDDLVIIDQSYG